MERFKFFRAFDEILDNFEDCKISADEGIELICEVGLREYKNTARENFIHPEEINGLICEAKKIAGLGKKLAKQLKEFKEQGSYPETTLVIPGSTDEVIVIADLDQKKV